MPKPAKHSELKLFLEAVAARGKSVNQAWNRTSSRTPEVRRGWWPHLVGVSSFQFQQELPGAPWAVQSKQSEPSLAAQLFTHTLPHTDGKESET